MFFTNYSLQFHLRLGRTLFKCNNWPQSSRTITTTPIRSDIFNIGRRMRNEKYYKKLDNIDPTYELIYRAPFEYLTACCKHVPTFSLASSSCIIAYKLAAGIQVFDPSAELTLGPFMSDRAELIGFTIAFYIMNSILIFGVTKYPLRIYKSKNRYIAMFEGYLPFSPKPFPFRRGDLGRTRSVLPWYESIYKIKDKTVLVFSHYFKRPADFNDLFKK